MSKVTLALAALVSGAALAQDVTEIDEQPEVRRYTVEMIIFSYAQSVSAGTEIFVPDSPPPVDDISDLPNGVLESLPEFQPEPEAEPVTDTSLDAALEDKRVYEIVLLDEQDFTLTDVIQRLERLDAYQPMLHFGWTQAMIPEGEPDPRPLSYFVNPPAGLEGELSLYLSRYLHLAVQLQLDAPNQSDRRMATQDRYRDAYQEFDGENYPIRYRLQEDRIFRNGELRYFDHPKFGVLAKITRVDDEPDENEQRIDNLADGELLGD